MNMTQPMGGPRLSVPRYTHTAIWTLITLYIIHYFHQEQRLRCDLYDRRITARFPSVKTFIYCLKLNSVAWVRERTIPTERPPVVGDVSANFCRQRVPRGQCGGSLRPYSRLSRPFTYCEQCQNWPWDPSDPLQQWYWTFLLYVPSNVIFLQLCTAKIIGV
jgi:hypothetical protein